MNRVAFIGLGHMGLPMAVNLVKAGFDVKAYDLSPLALNQFQAAGGSVCKSVQEAVKPAEVLISMLQTADQVRSVCSGQEGLFEQASHGALYIDCSSIDVQSSREIHHQALARGLLALDAPVSGGVLGAEQASLTFMVGGEEASFQKAQPVLKAMGKNIIHTGTAGSGQAAKLCNNMVLAVSMIAVSESFVLGEHLGLSPQKLFEVLNHASGQCWVTSKYPPVPGLLEQAPANHHYQPGFTAKMMLKDLNLSQAAAESVDVRTRLGAQAQSIYQQFNEEGFGDLDFSAIIKSIEGA